MVYIKKAVRDELGVDCNVCGYRRGRIPRCFAPGISGERIGAHEYFKKLFALYCPYAPVAGREKGE